MTQKTFGIVAGVIFGLVALAHLLRFLFGWPIVIDGYTIPTWLSAVGAILAAYLSSQAFRLRK